jgi:hypothetical protein
VGKYCISHFVCRRYPLELVGTPAADPDTNVPLIGHLQLKGIRGAEKGGYASIEHVVVGIHVVLDEREGRVSKQRPQDMLRNIH